MSYVPNPTIGGLGEMTETNNAVTMGIDQVNTWHPLWTSGVVAGLLDGWTFLAGVSGSFTSVANAGGGQITVTTSAPHGMLAGQVVTLTSASVAGYQPPNPTIFVIQSVAASTFNVIATFTATATGTFTRGASLKAGTAAAGRYKITWSVTAKNTGADATFKFAPCQNVSPVNTTTAGSLLITDGPNCMASSEFLTITAGDVITMLCMNQTNVADVTIIYANANLIRYAAP
jgi:hypothetical protein